MMITYLQHPAIALFALPGMICKLLQDFVRSGGCHNSYSHIPMHCAPNGRGFLWNRNNIEWTQ